MKNYPVLVASLLALSLTSLSSAAYANVVNFTGSDVNMGSVAIGQTGTVSDFYSVINNNLGFAPPPYIVSGVIFGTLPTMSKITFSYTLPGRTLLLGSVLTSNGSYGPNSYNGAYGYGTYSGDSSANSSTGNVNHGYKNGIASLPLVWATANLGGTSGTTGIQNNNTFASVTTTVASLFQGAFSGAPVGGSLTYRVAAIPLPASLPAFALGLLGLFGFNRFKRAREIGSLVA